MLQVWKAMDLPDLKVAASNSFGPTPSLIEVVLS